MAFMPSGLVVLGAGGGGGLADLNLGLTIWTIVLFGLFAFVLRKFAWGPLLEIVESREKTVREQLEGAEKAQAEAQALLAEQREKLREMARDREEMIERARKEAEQIRAELVSRARTDAEQILTRAREQIELDKNRVIREVRTEIADLAVEAARKIVKSSLTREAQKKLVKEYIAGLPRSPS